MNHLTEESSTEDAGIFRRMKHSVRRFPPPIPLLAQTGNLAAHMPWILMRTYEAGGRLVIREVRLKHHEFFRAHRSNGRLTLRLVHFEDQRRHISVKEGDKKQYDEEKRTGSMHAEEIDAFVLPEASSSSALQLSLTASERKTVDEGEPSCCGIGEAFNSSGCGGMCFSNGRTNPLLQISLPTIRPVHS